MGASAACHSVVHGFGWPAWVQWWQMRSPLVVLRMMMTLMTLSRILARVAVG